MKTGLTADDLVVVLGTEGLRPGMAVSPEFAPSLGRAASESRSWAHDMFRQGLANYDFGALARGTKVEHRFCVENIFLEDAAHQVGWHQLRLRDCGSATEVLKTWQRAYVVVKVDTSRFLGQKDATITVSFDKPFLAETQLSIHCFIRGDVLLTPDAVHFRTSQGHPAQQTVRLEYVGRPGWEILRVESANAGITGKVFEVSRAGGQVDYDLVADLAADVTAGCFRDQFTVVTNDPDPRAQRIMVPVEVSVVAPATEHPSPPDIHPAEDIRQLIPAATAMSAEDYEDYFRGLSKRQGQSPSGLESSLTVALLTMSPRDLKEPEI